MAKRRGGMPATLVNWTPARAARFALARVEKIKLALMEIAVCFDEVDSSIGWECDRIRDELDAEGGIVALVHAALEEGKTL